MNEARMAAYRERLCKVIDYITEHLHEDLSVESLSQVAHFSKHHFHRQFSAYCGISVFKFIQLLRLKRASYQLALRKNIRVIDIALNAGFENPESFSHAFKETINVMSALIIEEASITVPLLGAGLDEESIVSHPEISAALRAVAQALHAAISR